MLSKLFSNNFSEDGAIVNISSTRAIISQEDIVRVVMFLCDGENGFITGENITVDGGMT
jgi:hypothetical protein